MKPTPSNWPRISSSLTYRDAKQAIQWLCAAFGFEVRLEVEGPNGILAHSELVFGDGLIMVADERSIGDKGRTHLKSPASLGGAGTQSLMVYVDDAIAHCERARKAGATILSEPTVSDYGPEFWSDRSYECKDLDGHHWYFCERLRSPTGTPPTFVKH